MTVRRRSFFIFLFLISLPALAEDCDLGVLSLPAPMSAAVQEQAYLKMHSMLSRLQNFAEMDTAKVLRFSKAEVEIALKTLATLSERVYAFQDTYGLHGTHLGQLISGKLEEALSSPAILDLNALAGDYALAHANLRLNLAMRTLHEDQGGREVITQLDELIHEVSQMRPRLARRGDLPARHFLSQIELRLLEEREKTDADVRDRLDRLRVITMRLRSQGPRLIDVP